jgi:hypothetical protein
MIKKKETPNPKLQAPKKHQASIPNRGHATFLEIGDWSLGGV